MKKYPDTMRIKANAGFSLIDIMVGMVIALLGIIIIFQVFSVSEGVKRTTTSGGDAVQNAAAALFSLENSFKMAGYGILPSTNAALSLPFDPAGTAPVTITVGASNAPDSLVFKYRTNWDYGQFAPNSTDFPAAAPPALTSETITVQTHCIVNGVDNLSTLLQLCSSVSGVISDGIVLMKVEYGIDNTTCNPTLAIPPSKVNLWTQAAPANVMCVAAVRIALVARSTQPEVTRNAAGQIVTCATTTVAPTWIDSATIPLNLTAQADLVAAADDWKCYRYKTFENTVPLRNVIWR